MEFIINYLLPALGTTLVGLAVVILLIAISFVIIILAKIKDYKEIKNNLSAFISDIKKKFGGKGNRKNRIILLLVSLVFVASIFTISVVIQNGQIEKCLIITSPNEKAVYDVSDEMLLTWKPVPNTGMYYVTIYPIDVAAFPSIAACSFYVEGDKSGVKMVLGDLIYGTGKYQINVSSDAKNLRPGSVIVYLVDKQIQPNVTGEKASATP